MDILRSVYKNNLYTLNEWITTIDPTISWAEESRSFVTFVEKTVIAAPLGVAQRTNLDQCSDQKDLVMKLIEKLIKKEGTGQNVLTLGFGQMSEDTGVYMSTLSRLDCRHPNYAVTHLNFPKWRKLLSKVGGTMMANILEASVFTFVPPSSYVQLTGKPVFELWTPGIVIDSLPRDLHRERGRKNRKRKRSRKEPPTEVVKRSKSLQTSLQHEQYLPRKKILYSKELVEKIPKSYILNRLPPSQDGAEKLFEEIFKNVPGDSGMDKSRLTDAIQKLLHLHKRCPYQKLFDQCCSDRQAGNTVNIARTATHGKQEHALRTQKRKMTTKADTGSRLGIPEIHQFLRLAITKVIPNDLLGKTNKNRLAKCVKAFLKLGKCDKFTVKEMKIDQMKTVCILYKCYIAEAPYERIRRFVFYISVTLQRLHMRGIDALLKKKMFVSIPQTEAMTLMANGTALGVSGLRFIPKRTSLRPIINLGQKPPTGCKQNLPINRQLPNLLNVLKYHVEKNPEIVCSSLLGIDKIYPVWKKFASHIQSQSSCQPLFFTKVDFSNCYDNINQNKLFSIVKNIIEQVNEYEIRRYVTMYVAGGQIKKVYRKEASTLAEFDPSFIKFAKNRIEKKGLTNTIFVDQVVCQNETSTCLVRQLKSHVFNNLVKVGQRHFRQTRGISQGSTLSSMLCSIYCGHMEKELFPPLGPHDLLMRIVDDSLFVTPCKDKAIDFLNRMNKGLRDYNLEVNSEKVLTNFMNPTQDMESFPVHSIRDTIAFEVSREPLKTLKAKLLSALQPKSRAVNLDTELNTTDTVVTNIFKVFVLNALKFHSYQKRLPEDLLSSHNVYQYITDLLPALGGYFYHQTFTFLTKKGSQPAVFSISKDVVQWLCIQAYSTIFKYVKNKSSHKAIRRQSRLITARLESQEKGLPAMLKQLCGDRMPDDLQEVVT
ncbi:telomerase reverse transcriptase-like [Argopecten irradians]|uniref:telomerase reverse transcriptase-like n=1 Tax=Argopecten irradians TaxID=31199 RepID=UPI00372243D1